MIDELVDAVKCPRDYFEIECIKSVAIREGKIADVYPFVEVAWFDRGQEVQDTVAKIITDSIRNNLEIESMDLAFTVFGFTSAKIGYDSVANAQINERILMFFIVLSP